MTKKKKRTTLERQEQQFQFDHITSSQGWYSTASREISGPIVSLVGISPRWAYNFLSIADASQKAHLDLTSQEFVELDHLILDRDKEGSRVYSSQHKCLCKSHSCCWLCLSRDCSQWSLLICRPRPLASCAQGAQLAVMSGLGPQPTITTGYNIHSRGHSGK